MKERFRYTPGPDAWQADVLREMNGWFYDAKGRINGKSVFKSQEDRDSAEREATQAFAWYGLIIQARREERLGDAIDAAYQFGLFVASAFAMRDLSDTMGERRATSTKKRTANAATKKDVVIAKAKNLMKHRRFVEKGLPYKQRELARDTHAALTPKPTENEPHPKCPYGTADTIRAILKEAKLPRHSG